MDDDQLKNELEALLSNRDQAIDAASKAREQAAAEHRLGVLKFHAVRDATIVPAVSAFKALLANKEWVVNISLEVAGSVQSTNRQMHVGTTDKVTATFALSTRLLRALGGQGTPHFSVIYDPIQKNIYFHYTTTNTSGSAGARLGLDQVTETEIKVRLLEYFKKLVSELPLGR